MATDTNPTIGNLIHDAICRGMTRAQIADAVGCSRVQLWRLEKAEPRKETALTHRIREVLGQADPAQHSLVAAMQRIVGSDPNRREKMLHLLHALSELMAEPARPSSPDGTH